MTWSIVARDPQTGAFAVAVTTCNLAVGAACPFLRSEVGAVSTQSMSNRYLGPAVLDALARGESPKAGTQEPGRHTVEPAGALSTLKEMVSANHDYRGEW